MTTRSVVIFALFATAVSCVSAGAEDGDQNACMQDAFSICGQFIPNREQVAACLISHRSKVSAGCRSALVHFRPHTASVE
jgi:hypothetical protein